MSLWMTIHDRNRLAQAGYFNFSACYLSRNPLCQEQHQVHFHQPVTTSSLFQQDVFRSNRSPTRFPHCRFRVWSNLIVDVCFEHACERGVEAALLQLLVNFRLGGHFPTSFSTPDQLRRAHDHRQPRRVGRPDGLALKSFRRNEEHLFPDSTHEEPGCTARRDGAAAGE